MANPEQLPAFSFGEPVANLELLGPLSETVKRRIQALKKLQVKTIEAEAQFYEKVHALEMEFGAIFQPIYDERSKIVSGEKEPTDEEADYPLVSNVEDSVLEDLKKQSTPDAGEKGIKDFWLNVLKGCESINDLIQDHDAPILSYLTNITSDTHENPPRFSLHFYFAENPYFKNKVLSKEYFLQLKPDQEHPFDYDGPNVTRVTGDSIQWEEGKNVTKKVVKRKQKKGAKAGKFLTKTVKADSFFNFFDPPKSADDRNEDENDDDEDETDELLHMDYELGQTIRDSVIPRAILFYTGEIQTDDMFDFNGEDEEAFSEEDDE